MLGHLLVVLDGLPVLATLHPKRGAVVSDAGATGFPKKAEGHVDFVSSLPFEGWTQHAFACYGSLL